MMPVVAILIGLTTGVISGLIGLGGGVFIVPALVYVFKEDLINELSIRMNREPSEVHSQEDTQRRTVLAAPGAVGSVGGTLKRASTMREGRTSRPRRVLTDERG
jgi:uncharacterized membrane protein YfcA